MHLAGNKEKLLVPNHFNNHGYKCHAAAIKKDAVNVSQKISF